MRRHFKKQYKSREWEVESGSQFGANLGLTMMRSDRAEFFLSWLLRISGFMLLCATFAIFLTTDFMAWSHEKLGLGDFPHAPLTQYLTRSASALYALHGSVLMFTSFRVREYHELVRLLGLLNLAFGAAMLGIDLQAPMPMFWTLQEGPGIFVSGLLMLWLRSRMLRAQGG